ncbi:MAG: lipid-A-disaccharide synthase [Bacteroidota bacterium]
MRYYLIAGEASGDLHGSALVRALRQQDGQADCRAWGGALMREAGAEVVKDYRELAFMGFLEVAKNIRTIMGNFAFCKADVLTWKPDVLVLIDYPGFNLRIAKWAKKQGIRVFYYISPQLWAWNARRVHTIKRCVERLFVILPFEQSFYEQYDYPVDFVGHPLMDVIPDYPYQEGFKQEMGLDDRPVIALLPGSRKQEISRMLKEMLKMERHFPDHQLVVAGAPAQPAALYQALIAESGAKTATLCQNRTYDLLRIADLALVTSGTATLETALFGVPQVVCYQGNALSYQIAKRLIRVKYISLVNLIVDRPLVKELIQKEFTEENLVKELQFLQTAAQQKRIAAGYTELRERLGGGGASQRTAELIIKYLKD